jgi:nitroreductase
MDVFEAIKKRESVREYLPKPVEEGKLLKILEAGRLAPSASNRQEWRYVVVRDKKVIEELMRAANNQGFIAEAPVVIACCAETDSHVMRCGQPCYPIDIAISIDHITLAAVEEGLGSCWVGSFYEDQVKEILGIPPEIRVVELLTLGYPRRIRGIKQRKPLSEVVMFEKWGNRKELEK